MRQLVVENAAALRLVALGLGAFSVVFGGKALGRIQALTKPGGFYSSLLFAIPATAWFGAYAYIYDTLANHFISNSISRAVHVPIDTLSYAVGFGLLSGAFPALFLPTAFTLAGPGQRQQSLASMGWFSAGATVVYAYAAGVIGALFGAQYVFVILGWFGGQTPPLQVLLVIGAALPLLLLLGLITQAMGQPSGESVGCAKALGALLVSVLGLAAILVTLAQTAANAGFGIYLIHEIGWAAVILGGVGSMVYILLAGLRSLANRLPTQVLVAIFTFPGAVAALLGYALSNVGLLPS